ncbi:MULTISPECIES: hypothetical protein [unclassified Streptomyces]|nr:hypothetical protein OG569_19735 [Streptomyces sp. NBC_00827]
MPKDPYAVLRALLRADAVRNAPKPEPRRGPADQKPLTSEVPAPKKTGTD